MRHTVPAVRLTKAILLRLVYGVLSLVFISFVTFLAGELAPGDPATIIAGEKATPEAVQAVRVELGYDKPWPIRFVRFIAGASHGDFGNSYVGMRRPVSEILKEQAPTTITVALLAIVLASIVGIAIGTVAGIYRGRAPDTGILTLSTFGVTIPNFVLLPLLVYLFASKLEQLPGDWLAHRDLGLSPAFYFILPVLVLAARPAALLTRLTRASMVDTMQQEFIKTATAKGVPPMRLIMKHGLRNAILPVISAIGVNFGYLLTGSFVVERAYTMPGLGSRAIEAIYQRDIPVIQATVLVTGAMFIIINIIVDLILPILDPRIREAQI